MRWLRILGALVAMAVLFAAGWHVSMWLRADQERSVQSTPWPTERATPANTTRP